MHGDHRQLDQVGRGALHRRIDGGALRGRAARAVGRVDLGQPEPAAEHRLHEALALGLGARALHVARHARVSGEVAVDVELGRLALDVQVGRQPEGAHAVDQAEVDDLGGAPLIGRDLAHRHAEHLAGGGAMHVLAGVERRQQALVAADVRHDAQLDLRVVGADDYGPGRRDEGLADTPPFRRAYRNVLQVGVAGAQATGHGDRLAVAGVHAAGRRVDAGRQLVAVGRLELRQRAVLQQRLGQRIVLGQLVEHLLVGAGRAAGRLLDRRQAELAEQDLADLLGAAEIEWLTGERMRLCFQFGDPAAQFGTLRDQPLAVDQHAGAFHVEQDLADRQFDVLVHMAQRRHGFDPRPQHLMQPERDLGVLGGVLGRAVERHLVEADLAGALAADLDEGDRAPAQVTLRQRIHVMAAMRLQHVALQQRVVRDAGQPDAVVGKHVTVVLQMLAHLAVMLALQPVAQPGQRGVERQLIGRAGIAVCQRDVAGLVRLHRQRQPDQPRLHRIERGGFGIDADQRRGRDARQPGVELRRGQHRLVVNGRRMRRRIG